MASIVLVLGISGWIFWPVAILASLVVLMSVAVGVFLLLLLRTLNRVGDALIDDIFDIIEVKLTPHQRFVNLWQAVRRKEVKYQKYKRRWT